MSIEARVPANILEHLVINNPTAMTAPLPDGYLKHFDGPDMCLPEKVTCDGLNVTVEKGAEIDLNKIFDYFGITPSTTNLGAIGSTSYCSALTASAHQCISGGVKGETHTFPEEIDGKTVTPEGIADAINGVEKAVYYPDPQTYFSPVKVVPAENSQPTNTSVPTETAATQPNNPTETNTQTPNTDTTTNRPLETAANNIPSALIVLTGLGLIGLTVGTGFAIKQGWDRLKEKWRSDKSKRDAEKILRGGNKAKAINKAMVRITTNPGYVDPDQQNAILVAKPVLKAGTPKYNQRAQNEYSNQVVEDLRNGKRTLASEKTERALTITTHREGYGRPELDDDRAQYFKGAYPETDHRGPDAGFKGDLPKGQSLRPKGESGRSSGMRVSDKTKESEGYGTGSSRPVSENNSFWE